MVEWERKFDLFVSGGYDFGERGLRTHHFAELRLEYRDR